MYNVLDFTEILNFAGGGTHYKQEQCISLFLQTGKSHVCHFFVFTIVNMQSCHMFFVFFKLFGHYSTK